MVVLLNMKKLFVPLLFSLLISGCSFTKVEATNDKGNKGRDYSDYVDLQLEWKNLFLPAKSQYFVYIYSISCQHCNNIKQDVLTAVDEYRDWFYLIQYSSEIKTNSNVVDTIGKDLIEEVYILGTPTLLEISNHYVALNIAGEKDILSYLKLLPHSICD